MLIKDILEEQEQEYKDKYDKYEDMYMFALKHKDSDLEQICINRMAALKMLIERMPAFKTKINNKIKKRYED